MTRADAIVEWLPPDGMTGRVDEFDPRPGGRMRLVLTYDDDQAVGKSAGNEDVVDTEFVALQPDRRIVQRVVFESADPEFAGVMSMSWLLEPVEGGTTVSIVCENVPSGIGADDHASGLRSSLHKLAAYVLR